jgi:hypothetical protein
LGFFLGDFFKNSSGHPVSVPTFLITWLRHQFFGPIFFDQIFGVRISFFPILADVETRGTPPPPDIRILKWLSKVESTSVWPGVDVMNIIFCDWRFSQKPMLWSNFCLIQLCFEQKTPFFRQIYVHAICTRWNSFRKLK